MRVCRNLPRGAPEGGAAGTTATNLVAGDGPAPKIGQVASDFTGTTTGGKAISLSSLKGQAVWLTFWRQLFRYVPDRGT